MDAELAGAVVPEEADALGADDVALLEASEGAATALVPDVAGSEAAEFAVLEEQPAAAATTSAPPARRAMRFRVFTAR
ncbi:hypothetical protein ABIA31_004042 [Catenulispora sp. MAP5-51]|uniref:hypothetical protein n=1 Tax=Catenulispora sp. MAP5-51 TaxID=3156298 RepID=UPI0035185A82